MHHGQLQAVGSPTELKQTVSAQAHVAANAARDATLEDVFVALTGRHLRDE